MGTTFSFDFVARSSRVFFAAGIWLASQAVHAEAARLDLQMRADRSELGDTRLQSQAARCSMTGRWDRFNTTRTITYENVVYRVKRAYDFRGEANCALQIRVYQVEKQNQTHPRGASYILVGDNLMNASKLAAELTSRNSSGRDFLLTGGFGYRESEVSTPLRFNINYDAGSFNMDGTGIRLNGRINESGDSGFARFYGIGNSAEELGARVGVLGIAAALVWIDAPLRNLQSGFRTGDRGSSPVRRSSRRLDE